MASLNNSNTINKLTMQKFSGKITAILPVVERKEWKSVQFVVQETEGQYPQSCTFTKSAKGDNGKWVDEFEKNNPIGSSIEVEYTFKSREYQGKWYTDINAYKTVNANYKETAGKSEKVSQSEYNKVADANGLVQEPLPGEVDTELPF